MVCTQAKAEAKAAEIESVMARSLSQQVERNAEFTTERARSEAKAAEERVWAEAKVAEEQALRQAEQHEFEWRRKAQEEAEVAEAWREEQRQAEMV